MDYQRKIFYMNAYGNGEKIGNVGYIKVVKRGGMTELEVRILAAPTVFCGEKELQIKKGGEEIVRIGLLLEKGRGEAVYRLQLQGELERLSFEIELAEGELLASENGEDSVTALPEYMQQVETQNADETETAQEGAAEKEILKGDAEEEMWGGAVAETEAAQERAATEAEMPQERVMVSREREREQGVDREAPGVDKDRVEKRKWGQISKTYPHIRPFGDFREYVRLDLRDMVLLPEKTYHLVDNSFLLHGYYNYKHLILWKKEKPPVKYYIGVPGNFYEKEKQIALLYGFESFEGEVEPAREGSFGYYMAEVPL